MRLPNQFGEAEVVSASALKNVKAAAFARYIQRPNAHFAVLSHCERSKDGRWEAVVFQVTVEIGQRCVHDIRSEEYIGVIFTWNDNSYPEVLALRTDFPDAPHQNLRPFAYPRSLCLYEEPYAEVKIRWTPFSFLERIREWLRLTSRAELHQQDQPLEPLLSAPQGTVILPADLQAFVSKEKPEPIFLEQVRATDDKPVYRIRRARAGQEGTPPRVIATAVRTKPMEHGIIRSQPINLLELHEFLRKADYDLLGTLQERLRNLLINRDLGDIRQAELAILAVVPKTRHPNGTEESQDCWVFFVPHTIGDIAVALAVH